MTDNITTTPTGATSKLSGYIGAGMGLLNAATTFANNMKINDTDSYYDMYDQFGSQIYSGDFDSILNQRKGAYLKEAPTWKDIRGITSAQKSFTNFNSAASGAMAGASFGPWGIGIGAGLGLFSSWLGNNIGDNAAKNEANDLALARERALEDNKNNFLTGIDNATATVNHNALANIAKLGGPLQSYGTDWTNGITQINAGGTHEQNPYEGVPMGMDEEGVPNLVEEGEVVWNNYVFSNRIKVPKSAREKYKLKGKLDLTFAEAAKKAQKESEERPNDPIAKRGLEDIMTKLMFEQEMIREKREQNRQRRYAKGGKLGRRYDGEGNLPQFLTPKFYEGADVFPAFNDKSSVLPINPTTPSEVQKAFGVTPEDPFTGLIKADNPRIKPGDKGNLSGLSSLRFAPIIDSGLAAFSDIMGWSNKPDYSDAERIEKVAASIPKVSPKYISNYLQYKPFDINYATNILNSQNAATRRAIINNANGNRATAINGLLGANYTALNGLGDLMIKAQEFNLNRNKEVNSFNRDTDKFNSEMGLRAQTTNSEIDKTRYDAAIRAAAMRDTIDSRISAARNANRTNFFNNLGELGRESFAMEMIRRNPALSYDWFDYKPTKYRKEAKGGYLTIKNRRRK